MSLISLARDTYGDKVSDFSDSVRPMAHDNVYSCWYTSAFISLMAGCLSGLAAALTARNRMSNPLFTPGGLADRAIPIILLFVSLMVTMAVIAVVIGIFIFVWAEQSVYVAIAMTVSGGIFAFAIILALSIYLYDGGLVKNQ